MNKKIKIIKNPLNNIKPDGNKTNDVKNIKPIQTQRVLESEVDKGFSKFYKDVLKGSNKTLDKPEKIKAGKKSKKKVLDNNNTDDLKKTEALKIKEINKFIKNYKEIIEKTSFSSFEEKLTSYFNLNINEKINKRIKKIFFKTSDDYIYNNINFPYADKSLQEGIDHFMKTFETKDFSIKKINETQKYVINELYTPKYKKLIRQNLKTLINNLKNKNKESNDIKLNQKLEKIRGEVIDEDVYEKITFTYDEEPFNQGIQHFFDIYKTDDYSLKNINNIEKKLIQQFNTKKYKKLIKIEFQSLKNMIKKENLKEANMNKGAKYSSSQMNELKKTYKGDYGDSNIGANEFISNLTGKTNLDDDKIKKKKTKF